MCNHEASCERSIFFWSKEIEDRVAIERIQAVKRWDAWVVSHKNTVKGLQLCLMKFRRIEQLLPAFSWPLWLPVFLCLCIFDGHLFFVTRLIDGSPLLGISSSLDIGVLLRFRCNVAGCQFIVAGFVEDPPLPRSGAVIRFRFKCKLRTGLTIDLGLELGSRHRSDVRLGFLLVFRLDVVIWFAFDLVIFVVAVIGEVNDHTITGCGDAISLHLTNNLLAAALWAVASIITGVKYKTLLMSMYEP
jgi:hypothetical protein